MKTFNWITCDGGPHVFVPRDLVQFWQGTEEPSDGRIVQASFRWSADPTSPATDYDVACDVADILGTIPIAHGIGLVLGDEVPMSAWIPSGTFSSGTLVVPLCWPEPDTPDELLLSLLGRVPATAYADTGLDISSATDGFLHFAACDAPPDWIYATAAVPLSAGSYRIFTAETELEGFVLRLHGLNRNA